jgi:cell division protein FtsW
MLSKFTFDKPLFFAIITLVVSGLLIFGSAALGVLAVNEIKFYSIVKSQFIFAFIGGSIALCTSIVLNPLTYKKYALHLFAAALFLTVCVFIPGLSVYHGGAHRWIDIGPLSLQPSELLKFTTVAFIAYWASTFRQYFKRYLFGFFGFVIPVTLVTILLLLQPDFGTYLVIFCSSFVVYFIGGARYKHIGILLLTALLGFSLLILMRPYMLERVKTFFNASHDPSGSSWQLNQSLIALGSGGIIGKGYGQSIQKFNFLPEPIGDSVFAVLGEELGFIGTIGLLLLLLFILLRGIYIALHTKDDFLKLLAIGIVSIIFTQSFLNIGSMIRLMPLTGLPLPLISHGGTSFVITLFELGVLLSISRQKTI